MKNDMQSRIEQLENKEAKSNRPGYPGAESKAITHKGAKIDKERDFKMMRDDLVRGDDTEMKALAISTSCCAARLRLLT